MTDCEYFVEKKVTRSGTIYWRELCTLTGQPCIYLTGCEVNMQVVRLKCERRIYAAGYFAGQEKGCKP